MLRHRDFALERIRAGGGNVYVNDLTNAMLRCHDVHGLHVGAATDQLPVFLPWPFQQQRQPPTNAALVEGQLLLVEELLQSFEPLALHLFGDVEFDTGGRGTGPGAVLE